MTSEQPASSLLRLLALECLSLVLEGEAAWTAILANVVDNVNTLQRHKEVLVLLVNSGSISTSEVVQEGNALEDEVDQTNDNRHTERVGPDSDDGDDVGPVCVMVSTIGPNIGGSVCIGLDEPSEQTEESSKSIDDKDGTNELE